MPTLTFTSGNDSYTIPAGPGTYDLTFLAGDDTLTVNGGDSVIAHMDDGNDAVTVNALNLGGSATIYGGLGDDTFTVKTSGVTLVESSGQGTDLVKSSISWVLGANFENLTLIGSSLINGTGNTLANTITGNAAVNTLDGGSGNDTLFGNGGDDVLIGGAGLDKLNGGTGADSMAGGLNSDTYYVDNVGDVVTENAGEGIDTVISSIDYTLGANVEKLTLTGTAVNGTGNALANTIRGDDLDNMLDGGAGADAMSGGKGNDTYIADNINDRAFEAVGEGTDTVLSSVTFKLGSNVENLTLTGLAAVNGNGNVLDNVIIGNDAANVLYGSAGSDTLTGNGGNDMLNGGSGADSLSGGTGNDTYIVDNASDVVTENASEGTDLVKSTVSWTLGSDVENLTLLGALAINGTGNTFDNILTGNNAANTLDGSDGNDTLWGYGGIDTLIGGIGNDTLNGGSGADSMSGGIGNDAYYVDNAGDTVTENVGEGTDTVFATVSYTLGANVEKLTLNGSSGIDGTGNELANVITGNSGDNVLSGLDGNDTLNGAAGSDTLDGGIGADKMTGGLGDDNYVVDNVGDTVTENSGEGTDLVQSSITYTLGATVENLTLTGSSAIDGTGNELDNVITGNSAANSLSGLDGNDTLNGGAGADTLTGGLGNDTYVVDNAGDTVNENSGEGTDTVLSSITYTLGADVENLTLTGSSAINGTGNTLDNVITGNSANNIIDGGDGNDSIWGGAGTDTMTGGNGNDTFVFTNTTESLVGSADLITDFTSTSGAGASDDKLDLSGIDADTGTAGDQAFTWDQFTPTAHGLWIGGTTAGGALILYGDVNGDTTADFEIHVNLANGTLFTDDIVF
jgi:Ca2+-binding RTX toxin-like protein